MSITFSLTDSIQKIFDPTNRGVIGLVDDLINLCREDGLQLDWQADRCRVRFFQGATEELVEVSIPKTVFRAILARVAALCNERCPNSVSPYGGQGELLAAANPPLLFKAAFVNTFAEQRLSLIRVK